VAELGPTSGVGRCERRDGTNSRPSIRNFLTNLDQPMPLGEKLSKLVRNLWRRVALGQPCCGHPGEPGC
jgi:hypothetical protein